MTSALRPDVTEWYWIHTDGRIYSSEYNKLVYSYDSNYLAFCDRWGNASPWPIDASGKQTNAALAAVLAYYGITLSFQ